MIFAFVFMGALLLSSARSSTAKDNDEASLKIESFRLNLWSRGLFDINEGSAQEDQSEGTFFSHEPVSYVRRDILEKRESEYCDMTGFCSPYLNFRGGAQALPASDYEKHIEKKIEYLGSQLGQEFLSAIEQNKKEHEEDCKKSCEVYFCASPETPLRPIDELIGNSTIKSYSMGPVPPEDFAESFGFPLDIIKVTENAPLFDGNEAAEVVAAAEAEGVHENEFNSGKYKLAGDWLVNLPNTRKWFNGRLETTFFPLLANLFPEIISSPSVIRAHSVSLLKYNASHPRTDVHIDNGILAMTIAMTPMNEYVGGGTFFEHMGIDNVLQMDVGHGTFRPGSVRHGGHRVSSGTRYILGAFLLLENRVEHVGRLKNRGSELRKKPDLEGAAKQFEFALALNPKCTTCLKDWAEILYTQKQYAAAEEKIRKALELLEYKDSDALFVLGVLLSEQGRDDESIQSYYLALELNAEDAELCYNLGTKLGAKGLAKEEMKMYAMAVGADPKFGGAWLNWGTSLAEQGNLDDAEIMFLKAAGCEGEVSPKAMVNLGLLYNRRGNLLAQGGDMDGARRSALESGKYLDQAKPLLDGILAAGTKDQMIATYMEQYGPLRLQSHQLIGQIHAGGGDWDACEAEFRLATEKFPNHKVGWRMLQRALEVQGKTEELGAIQAKIDALTT